MLIDITLADVEGVIGSRTDHATGMAEVTYDDSLTSPERITEAIRSVGYEAELD
jgi:copper chaperone CopZ